MKNTKVYPGINPRAQINNFSFEERKIARAFEAEFYITGGFDNLKLGQSEYRYFFIKFPEEKSALFGVRDEIIVLLSPFENFEPRTLDAIEKFKKKTPASDSIKYAHLSYQKTEILLKN